MSEMKPLFLPLKSVFFDVFKSGSKTYELRGIGMKFNPKTIIFGRKIILSKGYTKKERSEGVIGNVFLHKELEEISEDIWNKIIPLSIDDLFFNEFIYQYKKKYHDKGFIVFEIKNIKVVK